MEPIGSARKLNLTVAAEDALSAGGAAPTLSLAAHPSESSPSPQRPSRPVYWRVEGSLLELTTIRPIAFFTWNRQTYSSRVIRRSLVLLMAALRPYLYAANRKAATRIVYSVLRGISRDRLDLLGEEEFEYNLKPLLKPEGVRHLQALLATGAEVVLVSQGLDHIMRPLARHLGVKWIIANRLDFREGLATGRLLSPVIRPRGILARLREAGPDGRQSPARWVRALGLRGPRRWQRRLNRQSVCRLHRCGPSSTSTIRSAASPFPCAKRWPASGCY